MSNQVGILKQKKDNFDILTDQVPLEHVIITDELDHRSSRAPDYQAENLALRELSKLLSQSPQAALEGLVDHARRLCRGDSAGISLEEVENGKEIFRWKAISGDMKAFLHGTMPRDFSPCGVVTQRRKTILMKGLTRHYGYTKALGLPLCEVLLVPFYQDGRAIGTVWVVSNDPEFQFEREDQRMLESLAEFTGGVVQSYFRAQIAEKSTDQLSLAEGKIKIAQQNIAELFRLSQVIVAFMKGPEHKFEFVNPAHIKLLGGVDATGKTVLEVQPEAKESGLLALLDLVYFEGKTIRLPEETFPIGTEMRSFDFMFTPSRDAHGNVDGVMALVNDVTDKTIARAQIEKSVVGLQKEREMREQFVATLTHDLRTPLTAARMAAQFLQIKERDQATIEMMAARVVGNIDRAENMVRDLLDANQIKAGEGLPVSIDLCHLDFLIDRVSKELRTMNGNRFEVRNEVGTVIGHWDSDAIQRVIENLVSNAVKYGTPSTPITIGLRKYQELVEISVHNLGNPISDEDQKMLFESYRRTDSAISSGQKGWGIGLTIVKGVAEAHHGFVDVKSSPESGTTFFVRLPLDSRSV